MTERARLSNWSGARTMGLTHSGNNGEVDDNNAENNRSKHNGDKIKVLLQHGLFFLTFYLSWIRLTIEHPHRQLLYLSLGFSPLFSLAWMPTSTIDAPGTFYVHFSSVIFSIYLFAWRMEIPFFSFVLIIWRWDNLFYGINDVMCLSVVMGHWSSKRKAEICYMEEKQKTKNGMCSKHNKKTI